MRKETRDHAAASSEVCDRAAENGSKLIDEYGAFFKRLFEMIDSESKLIDFFNKSIDSLNDQQNAFESSVRSDLAKCGAIYWQQPEHANICGSLLFDHSIFTLFTDKSIISQFKFNPLLKLKCVNPNHYDISENGLIAIKNEDYSYASLLLMPEIECNDCDNIYSFNLQINHIHLINNWCAIGFTDHSDGYITSGCYICINKNGKKSSIEINYKKIIEVTEFGEMEESEIIECKLNVKSKECTFKLRKNDISHTIKWDLNPINTIYAGIFGYNKGVKFTIIE